MLAGESKDLLYKVLRILLRAPMAAPLHSRRGPVGVHFANHVSRDASQEAAVAIERLRGHRAGAVLLQKLSVIVTVLVESAVDVETGAHGTRLCKGHGVVVKVCRGNRVRVSRQAIVKVFDVNSFPAFNKRLWQIDLLLLISIISYYFERGLTQ